MRGTVPDTFGGISLRNYLGQFCILKQLGGMRLRYRAGGQA
jgi:hypothetical protein